MQHQQLFRRSYSRCLVALLFLLGHTIVVSPAVVVAQSRAVPGDYDGSGATDVAIVRQVDGVLHWFVRHDNGFVGQVPFGLRGDTPIAADYNGDGNVDPGVIRDNGGFSDWYVLEEATTTARQFSWGLADDTFRTGYYDEDATADAVAIRAVGGVLTWFIRGSSGSTATEVWGLEGSTPFAADVTGDGVDELVVVGAEAGFLRWYARTFADAIPLPAPFFGLGTDTPLPPFDIDRDGIADFIVSRDVGGFRQFFIRLNNADLSAKAERSLLLGLESDTPTIGAFFPGQEARIAVFRNRTAFASSFIDLNGDPAAAMAVDFGLQNDTLVPAVGPADDNDAGGLATVCPATTSFGGGILWKPSSDHSGQPREGRPAALFKRAQPGKSCIRLFASNGEVIGALGRFHGTPKYGDRFYLGLAGNCGAPVMDAGDAAAAAIAASGSPEIYVESRDGLCVGPADPRQRTGSL
ncbi:MAG: VCBS repeat-containing protein [Bdellovibrionales bacterium]|nr:VCBS repeat-containing protein [Bdellovibrionales bacterium]